MKLTQYLIDLFLSSDDGAALTEGFSILLGVDVDLDETAPGTGAPAAEDAGLRGGEEASDEEAPPLSAAASARCALTPCFNPITHAVSRTLAENKSKPPTNRDEAVALYGQLVSDGVVVRGKDVDGAAAESRWFDLGVLGSDDVVDELLEADEASEPEDELETLGGGTDDGFKAWAAAVAPLSWALHEFAPEQFMPYAFVHRFNYFEAICVELGIPLPRLPGKAGYQDRAFYYLEINDALQEFRRELGLSPAEFDAFLYGFAVSHVPEDEASELPGPERAWFLMADPDEDFDDLDAADQESRHFWQGNCDTRPGDICVMWCRSPRSAVHSLWRATSRGFADPFFFHYRTVWIGHPTLVRAVTFRELQQDSVWSQKPALRAHFQGSSGREVTADEYDALLAILAHKGCDVSTLPRLSGARRSLPQGIETERDVEEKLLEPLLGRLGYEIKAWVRQMPVRMGRGERVYPDYAFGVAGGRGEESARLIVEAKLRIRSDFERREAYLQARSYAERLRCASIVLCALEGVWLFERKTERFAAERFVFRTWSELDTPSAFRQLEDAIGKRSRLWQSPSRYAE